MPYSLYSTFFKEHPKIKSIYFETKNGKIRNVTFYNYIDSPQGRENYYLDFEGDKYLFDKNYPQLIFNKLSSLDFQVFPENKEYNIFHKTNTEVFRNSIVYEIQKSCCLHEKNNNFQIDLL